MRIFGQVECYKCEQLVNSDQCQKRTIEIESGRSGGSWSIGGSRRGGNWNSNGIMKKGTRKSGGVNVRYNAGRTYYKKVDVYVCKDCLTKETEEAEQRSKEFWSSIGVLITISFICFIVWMGYLGINKLVNWDQPVVTPKVVEQPIKSTIEQPKKNITETPKIVTEVTEHKEIIIVEEQKPEEQFLRILQNQNNLLKN